MDAAMAAQAATLAREAMLHRLWVHVCGLSDEPVAEAEAARYLVLGELEDAGDIASPDRRAVFDLAIDAVEKRFAAIIAELSDDTGHAPFREGG